MNRSAIAAGSGALGVLALLGAFAGGYAVGHSRSQPTIQIPTVTVTVTPSAPAAAAVTTTATSATAQSPHLAPTSASSAPVVIYTCTHAAVSAPASYVLACADEGITLTGLRWSDWGAATAHASGNLVENDCTPNCAQGHDVAYPASVTVTGLKGHSYTWMSVQAPQAPGGPYDYTLAASGPS